MNPWALMRFFLIVLIVITATLGSSAFAACVIQRPTPFADLWKLAQHGGIQKDEFETTAAWEARLRKSFPTDMTLIGSAAIPSWDINYDADTNVLRVDPKAWLSETDGDHDVAQLIVGQRLWNDPSYVATTALGMTKTVSVRHVDRFSLYWMEAHVNPFQPSQPMLLSVSPYEAKSLKEHLSLVVVAHLEPPYVKDGIGIEPPTLDNPTKTYRYEKGLIVAPVCAALVDDRSWSVLGNYDIATRKPLN